MNAIVTAPPVLQHYRARELAMWTEDEIWALPKGRLHLEFDDGVVEAKSRSTIISWYIWGIHRAYPNTPLLSRHYAGNKHLTSKDPLKLFNYAFWEWYETYQHVDPIDDIEKVCKLVYELENQLYNAITYRLEAYVTSISALDFSRLMHHPKIKEANDTIKRREDTIENTYAKIRSVLLDPNELTNNQVAKAARYELVRMGQVLQCVGPRGRPTDIDSWIFREPIVTGFAEGMRTMLDLMMESRSASKALHYAKTPMQISEYFNRVIQMVTETLQNLHIGDCGSQQYINFHVNPGDIPALLGIYRKKEDGSLQRITDKDHHLVGKTIQIRSVFGCKHQDRYGVCSTCFGDLALSFPKYTNLGHFSAIQLLAEVGQRLLSTKHEDSSSELEEITIAEYDRTYICKGDSDSTLKLIESWVGKDIKLIIPLEDAQGLVDVVYVSDINSLIPTRISDLTQVWLCIKTGDVEKTFPIAVSSAGRNSSLTHAALDYIKTNGWTVDNEGNYVVDMKGWSNQQPLFELPQKHFNMVDFLYMVKRFINGDTKNKKKVGRSLISHSTPEAALMDFHDLVRSKVDVNISHLQAIILSTMIESGKNRDYRIPGPDSVGEFSRHKQLMGGRSLGVTMAYQNQSDFMLDISSFLSTNRPPHPADDLLVPNWTTDI